MTRFQFYDPARRVRLYQELCLWTSSGIFFALGLLAASPLGGGLVAWVRGQVQNEALFELIGVLAIMVCAFTLPLIGLVAPTECVDRLFGMRCPRCTYFVTSPGAIREVLGTGRCRTCQQLLFEPHGTGDVAEIIRLEHALLRVGRDREAAWGRGHGRPIRGSGADARSAVRRASGPVPRRCGP
jgi:hypothetical protein